MGITKLFRVLVIGGSVLATGCTDDEAGRQPPDGSAMGAARTADAAGGIPGEVDASGTTSIHSDAGSTVAMECGFCRPVNVRNEQCCDYATTEDEVGTPKPGFECCWGTGC